MWTVAVAITLASIGQFKVPRTSTAVASVLTCTAPDLAAPTVAQVNTRIGTAADGDVICITGNPTWGSTISPSASKAVTLACKPSTTCNVAGSGVMFSIPGTSSAKLFRITGFNITYTGGGFLFWTCTAGGCTNTWSNLRIDHNTISFDSNGGIVLFVGESSAKQYVYGVMDHNTVTSAVTFFAIEWINATDNAPPSPPLGTANNFFVEDNTFSSTSMTDITQGFTDGWGQMAVVFRHNTTLNGRLLIHAVTHGGGPSNFEVYDNIINFDTGAENPDGRQGYRAIHHQGANTYMVFNNTITPFTTHSSDPIVVQHYRSFLNSIDSGTAQCDGVDARDGNRAPTATWRGYPCWRQPGRDVSGTYKPIYNWNNQWGDDHTRIDMVFNGGGSAPDYSSIHMVQNREWYNAVSVNAQTSATSPFNGTTGMGFGTLARRPTTCTTSTESGAGVGYYATDTGILYTCSATDTWTTYYTPYTYPHPLATNP